MEPGPELPLLLGQRALSPLSRRGGARMMPRLSEIKKDRLWVILYHPIQKGSPGNCGREERKRAMPIREGRLALLIKLLPREPPSTIS